MIPAISNFSPRGIRINSNQKINKADVNFTSNLDDAFKALEKEARGLGIPIAVGETVRSLAEKIERVKNPSFLDKFFNALNNLADKRMPGPHW